MRAIIQKVNHALKIRLRDQVVAGSIILQWVLKNQDLQGGNWIRFRIWASGRLLQNNNEALCSIKSFWVVLRQLIRILDRTSIA